MISVFWMLKLIQPLALLFQATKTLKTLKNDSHEHLYLV